MKEFFKQLLGFFLFLLGFALAIQLVIDWRIRHKVVSGVDTLDYMEGEDNELVFLGSSRCYAEFDPALFEKALGVHAANLGVDGHSELTMQLLRLENYLAKHPAPRVAILAFDPMVSAGSLDNNQNMYCKNQFARYALWSSRENEPIVHYFHFGLLERYLPLYALLKYKMFNICATVPDDKTWRRDRYERHDEHWDTLSHPIGPGATITSLYFADADTSLEKALIQMDSLCASHQIRLACVQVPMYQAAYIKQKFAFTAAICSRLHIPFFDLCTPELDSDINNFYNINHCNSTGVAKMTRVLLADPAFGKLFESVRPDRTPGIPDVTRKE
ncbi:MAG TPA: hypothetical protein VG605_18720 [Puia sp.]|nr:hypothetical protein [Puia sp.]